MALASYVANNRKKAKGCLLPGISISNRLARRYSSQLRSSMPGIIRESLAVLVHIGLLEKTIPAKVIFHTKKSAQYCLAPAFLGRTFHSTDDETNKHVRWKLSNAHIRREKGLNARFPIRRGILRDLEEVSIPPTAQAIITRLLESEKMRPATFRTSKAITTKAHTVKIVGSGQIVTPLNSCPRDLKKALLLRGAECALCDITSAHWMFLPRLIADRLDYCIKRGGAPSKLPSLRKAMSVLTDFCSSGSFYEKLCPAGASTIEVTKRKLITNMLMNSPETKAQKNVIWRQLRKRSPIAMSIIGDIKKTDHRKISAQYRHFTANAINAALLELQAQSISAIPDTDCLIVRQQDRAAACYAIGKAMFTETRGVCVTVGGIKYEPQ